MIDRKAAIRLESLWFAHKITLERFLERLVSEAGFTEEQAEDLTYGRWPKEEEGKSLPSDSSSESTPFRKGLLAQRQKKGKVMANMTKGDRVKDEKSGRVGTVQWDEQGRTNVQWDDGSNSTVPGWSLMWADKSLPSDSSESTPFRKGMDVFKVGDNVQITSGLYGGEIGTVVKVQGPPTSFVVRLDRDGDTRSFGEPMLTGVKSVSAFGKGLLAQKQGKSMSDNPYAKGLETLPNEMVEWEKGFLSGEKGFVVVKKSDKTQCMGREGWVSRDRASVFPTRGSAEDEAGDKGITDDIADIVEV